MPESITVEGFFTAKRIGSIPGGIALDAVDIAECEFENGRKAYITWGFNLSRGEEEWYAKRTDFEVIWLSLEDGMGEFILPDDVAQFYLPALTDRDEPEYIAPRSQAMHHEASLMTPEQRRHYIMSGAAFRPTFKVVGPNEGG